MSYSSFYGRLYNIRKSISAAFMSIFRFFPARVYLIIIAALQAIAWLQAFFIQRNLNGDFLVLHYNVDFGVDLVGNPSRIYYYSSLGLLILLVNLIFAAVLRRHKDGHVFIHLFLGTAVLFNALLNLALLSIYFVNFR